MTPPEFRAMVARRNDAAASVMWKYKSSQRREPALCPDALLVVLRSVKNGGRGGEVSMSFLGAAGLIHWRGLNARITDDGERLLSAADAARKVMEGA